MKYILLVISILVLAACEETPTEAAINTSIIGCWVNPELVNDSIWMYQRNANLKEDEVGYQFLENDTLIYRWSGWCGTPPLSFFDQKHHYSIEDSIIKIYTPYDHQLGESWKLKSINAEQLQVVKEFHAILY